MMLHCIEEYKVKIFGDDFRWLFFILINKSYQQIITRSFYIHWLIALIQCRGFLPSVSLKSVQFLHIYHPRTPFIVRLLSPMIADQITCGRYILSSANCYHEFFFFAHGEKKKKINFCIYDCWNHRHWSDFPQSCLVFPFYTSFR